jgi:hypothetical protein
MERYAVKLGTGRVTHALVQGSEDKAIMDLTARDILCNRWSKSGEVHVQGSDEVTCKGCADLLIDIAAYEALEDMAGTWVPTALPFSHPAVANPHYACDTHGATCPTGEHVSHTVGNPYPGCDRCAQETPADRHMTGRCREVVGTHCHCTLEYGMPDGQRRSCMVCEPSGERTVSCGHCGDRFDTVVGSIGHGCFAARFRARNGKRKPSTRRGW